MVVQAALAARFRLCLTQIDEREARRERRYTWVVRTRPDIYMSCLLRPPSVATRRGLHTQLSYIAYAYDVLALMLPLLSPLRRSDAALPVPALLRCVAVLGGGGGGGGVGGGVVPLVLRARACT